MEPSEQALFDEHVAALVANQRYTYLIEQGLKAEEMGYDPIAYACFVNEMFGVEGDQILWEKLHDRLRNDTNVEAKLHAIFTSEYGGFDPSMTFGEIEEDLYRWMKGFPD